MVDEVFFIRVLGDVYNLRARLIAEAGADPEKAISVASAMATAAMQIYDALGGKNLMAHQFYHLADKAAGEIKEAG